MIKKCYNCRAEHTGEDMLCEECLPFGVTEFCATTGLSDGPSSGRNELVFDRPDSKKAIELTCKKMEANGTFIKNKQLKALAEYKWKKAQSMKPAKVDYQKTGYPSSISGMV